MSPPSRRRPLAAPLRAAAIAAAAALALLLDLTSPAGAASGWSPAGNMTAPHRGGAAASLPDGDVLVVSGRDNAANPVPSAERYDASANTWVTLAPPLVPRYEATATRLNDGRVLLAGGEAATGVTTHAELYDPSANTWTATGALTEVRAGHSAVLLADGRVLVAGGGDDDADLATATAEVYDPATGTWTQTTNAMSAARVHFHAARLPDGRVLAAGGYQRPPLTFLATADLYDPATGSWSPTGTMATAKAQGATALLPDGTVLAAGGVSAGGFVRAIERYDPAAGSWSTAPGVLSSDANVLREAILEDGRVLLQGDLDRATALFDPATGGLAPGAWATAQARAEPIVARLQDGRVLVAGGGFHVSAELFMPPTERSATGGFAGTDVGAAVERDVEIENSGGNRLQIRGTALDGDDAADYAIVSDGCTPSTLMPGGRCVVRVRFTPSETGARDAELTFDDNAEQSPAVTLGGRGYVRELDADVSTLAFGTQETGTTSAAQTVELTGAGGPVALAAATVRGPFAIVDDACAGETIAPGETCTIAVAFAPTATGVAEGTLTVPSDLTGAPVEVALRGEGTTPPDPPEEPRRPTPEPPAPPAPEPPAPPAPQPPNPPAPPRPSLGPPVIERFALERRCVRPLPGARSQVGLILRLNRVARVRIQVARAVGTRGMLVCPPRGSRATFDGDLAKPVTLTRGSSRTAVASSVLSRHTLSLKLRPALYRITVRPYVGKGRLGRPVHRWLRVLAP